jgi:hypothetical protein
MIEEIFGMTSFHVITDIKCQRFFLSFYISQSQIYIFFPVRDLIQNNYCSMLSNVYTRAFSSSATCINDAEERVKDICMQNVAKGTAAGASSS